MGLTGVFPGWMEQWRKDRAIRTEMQRRIGLLSMLAFECPHEIVDASPFARMAAGAPGAAEGDGDQRPAARLKLRPQPTLCSQRMGRLFPDDGKNGWAVVDEDGLDNHRSRWER